MVIAAVDPNKADLKLLVKYLRLVNEGCTVVMFSEPQDAAAYMRDNPIDVLFTEVAMSSMTGFQLQAAVEAVQPAVLTVLLADTDEYALQGIRTRVVGYIQKPVTREAVRDSLNDTRFSRTKTAIQKI